MDALRALGAPGHVVRARRPRPRVVPGARAAPGRRRDADAGARRARPRRSASPRGVLPMSDEPVRTRVLARGAWHGLQEFLIRERAAGPVDGVAFDGIDAARAHAAGPAGARRGSRDRHRPVQPDHLDRPDPRRCPGCARRSRAAPAPVVAVSPIVGGAVLKGPTAAFLAHAGLPATAAGVSRVYAGVIDGLLARRGRRRRRRRRDRRRHADGRCRRPPPRAQGALDLAAALQQA